MPMTCEASGYGYNGRQPAGRSIVEERGDGYKLTVWAQDLRSETIYSIFLLFEDGGRYAGIEMGTLPVDKKGKGEVRLDFGHEMLGDFKLTDIAGVALVVRGTTSTISPLCGYRSGQISWRHVFYEYTQQTVLAYKQEYVPEIPVADTLTSHAVEPVPQEVAQQEDEPIVEELHESTPTTNQQEECLLPEAEHEIPIPLQSDENTLPPDECQESTLHQPSESPESIPEPSPQSPLYDPTPIWHAATQAMQPRSEIAQSFRMALDQLHADTIQRSLPTHQSKHPALDALFAINEPVFPFQKQSRDTSWVRVNLSDTVPPPSNKPHLFESPFVQTALAQHGHLILGMTTDPGPRRYIIGVPGNYDYESRLTARRLGFTQFKPQDDTRPSKNEPGYWLMFIAL